MNFRDVELLSTYLDGQLNPADSARLESRLKTDLELVSVMDDLRAARGTLRQLPSRRAPRNFALTPKMVGIKPPLPRAYPVFRFASVFAALLFFLGYAANFVAPRLSASSAPAPAFGIGGGCGEPCNNPAAPMPAAPQESFAATQAPAATEAPAIASTQQVNIAPTETPLTVEDSARVAETPTVKNGEPESTNGTPPEVQNEAPVSYVWLIGFVVVAVLSALVAYFLRLSAIRKWRRRVNQD